MVTCCVKGCLNQSRLNKNVSYHKIPCQERRYKRCLDKGNCLTSLTYSCCKDSFDESQELKQSLLGSNLRGASLLRVLCVNVNMMLSFKTSTPMPIKILQHKPPTNTYQRWKLRVIYACILHTR